MFVSTRLLKVANSRSLRPRRSLYSDQLKKVKINQRDCFQEDKHGPIFEVLDILKPHQ